MEIDHLEAKPSQLDRPGGSFVALLWQKLKMQIYPSTAALTPQTVSTAVVRFPIEAVEVDSHKPHEKWTINSLGLFNHSRQGRPLYLLFLSSA